MQPNDVKNESNDYKHKNSNYSCQDDVIARALAFLSSYEKKSKPPICLASLMLMNFIGQRPANK